MMTHKVKQISKSTSLREETHTTSNNSEKKETISSFVTLETTYGNLHQITKMETLKHYQIKPKVMRRQQPSI